jgi:hypothetical protein
MRKGANGRKRSEDQVPKNKDKIPPFPPFLCVSKVFNVLTRIP